RSAPRLHSVSGRRRAPASPIFPYTTLFRSESGARHEDERRRKPGAHARDAAVGLPPVHRCARIRRAQASRPKAKERLGVAVHQRSEEHTSELQSQSNLVCRLLLEKKKK